MEITFNKEGTMVKRVIGTLALIATLAYSQGSDSNDSYSQLGDDGKPLKVKDRDGYMPNIITPEYAKSGIYGGLGLGVINFSAKGDQVSSTKNMTSLSLLAGYNINEYLAAESRASISIANDDNINFKSIGIYLKPQYNLYDDLSIYSLLGFGRTSAQSALTYETDAAKTSFQLGFGADYKLPNNFKFFADYTFMGTDKKAKYKNNPASIKTGAFTSGISYEF